MALTPDASAETVPGYIFDQASGQWYQVGTGPHAHADYVPLVGGVSVQPGTLSLVAPVNANDAARYVDAIPRFPSGVERNAFYATTGGPMGGETCYQDDVGSLVVYRADIGLWLVLGNDMAQAQGSLTQPIIGFVEVPLSAITVTAGAITLVGGRLQVSRRGWYRATIQGVLNVPNGGSVAADTGVGTYVGRSVTTPATIFMSRSQYAITNTAGDGWGSSNSIVFLLEAGESAYAGVFTDAFGFTSASANLTLEYLNG